MNSAEAELERRRERGRLAQSAFRKRQAKAKQSIAAETSALKSAIASIAAELRGDERPELQAKIRHAAEIAGLSHGSASHHRSDSDKSSFIGHHPTPDVSESSSQSSGGNGTPSSSWGVGSSASPARSSGSMASSGLRLKLNSPGSYPLPIHKDPFQCHQCSEGVAAVLPFLGQGAFTFAGLIFWHLVIKHDLNMHRQESFPAWQLRKKRLLQYAGVMPDANNREAVITDLTSRFPSIHQTDPETWLSILESRLDYYQRQGKSQPNTPPTASHYRKSYPQNGGLDPAAFNENAHKMLSPITVEQRIRSIVGDEVFSVMAKPVMERWKKKQTNHDPEDGAEELIDALLDRLSETSVCTGNGPHWESYVFDAIFQEWCSSVTGSPIGLGGMRAPVNVM